MNTITPTSPIQKFKVIWISFSGLFLLSLITFLFQSTFQSKNYFNLQLHLSAPLNNIGYLPLLLSGLVIALSLTDKIISDRWSRPLGFMLILFWISPEPEITFFLFVLSFFIFYFLRRSSWFVAVSCLFLVALTVTIISYYTYIHSTETSFLLKFSVIYLKSCFVMRLVSWATDLHLYKKPESSSLSHFLEYIFCPIFFIFPGQIQYLQFHYFHQNKNKFLLNRKAFFQTVLLGLWGLILGSLFIHFESIFWSHFNSIPQWVQTYGFLTTHLAIGLLWLILIYWLQAAGMSMQIAMARFMGYQFKYDMHWPLLTRTPIEYLRNHSSYFKDFVVNVGLKPLSLYFLRKNKGGPILWISLAALSYTMFNGYQTGIKPDFNRGLLVTLAMTLFLIIFLIYEALLTRCGLITKSGESENNLEQIKKWRKLDYLLWIMNIIILSLYKAALGLALNLRI